MTVDAFQIMPNHVHGVVVIGEGGGDNVRRRDAINRVSTGGATITHNPMGQGSLGEIIRWFKGRTSHDIHVNIDKFFTWQPRYHDRIIRDEFEHNRIRKYIRENLEKWEQDELYTHG